jgi:hypothetical protein
VKNVLCALTETKMGKRRRDGRAMALAIIRRCGKGGASALDIGNAVAKGPARHRMSMAAREMMGLEMAASLVRDGLVTATRGNCFILARYKGKVVPPPVEVESDGIRRRPSYAREKGTFGAASGVRIVDKEKWEALRNGKR